MKYPLYAAIASFAFLAQGCSIAQNNIVNSNQLKIENFGNTKPYVSNVYASENDGKLSVNGKVRLIRGLRPPYPHVDMAIYAISGELISKKSVSYSPKYTYQKGIRYTHFYAEFNNFPPKGSVLKIAHHNTRNPDDLNGLKCGLVE